MLRSPTTSDPARDTAALLLRLGFCALVLLLPVAALFFRRGAVVLFPIGAALLIGSALLAGRARPLRASAAQLANSAPFVLTLFGLVWAAVSMAWSPAPGASIERLAGTLGTLALGLAAYLALPERIRSANLSLLPIGVALASVAAVAALLLVPALAEPEEDGRGFERGMAILTLLLWPGITWLRSRDRDGQAIALVATVTAATLIAPRLAVAIAFAAGALAFVATSLAPRAGAALTGTLIAVATLGLPLPALFPEGQSSALPSVFGHLRDVFAGSPVRLLTGRGFGAFMEARLGGRLPAAATDTALVQVWYDLGLIGALAAAAAVGAGLWGAAQGNARLLPGVVAATACAFTLACAGMGSLQAWQPVALCVLTLVFVSVERGQFRTRRPKASLSPSTVPPRAGSVPMAGGRPRSPG